MKCLAIVSVIAALSSSSAIAQTDRIYSRSEIHHLPFGDGIDQLGYRESSWFSDDPSHHDGPVSFAVNPVTEDIAILDYVKECVKIFSRESEFIASIDVEGGVYVVECEMDYDKSGNLWLHHSLDRYVKKYSASGSLLRTVRYSDTGMGYLGLDVVSDSLVVITGQKLVVDPASIQMVDGVETCAADIVRAAREEQRAINTGAVTGNHYERVGPARGSDKPPSYRITMPDKTVRELVFEQLSPLSLPLYAYEDIAGNSYFTVRIFDARRQVWIYNRLFDNPVILEMEPSSDQYGFSSATGHIEILPDGSLFQMVVMMDGVRIYKWE